MIQYLDGFEKTTEVLEKFLKDHGVTHLELYAFRNRLFLNLETKASFELNSFQEAFAHVDVWNKNDAKYLLPQQKSSLNGYWKLLERVYQLDQSKEEKAVEGYEIRPMDQKTKRIVEARQLVKDQKEVKRYQSLHALGKAWPEITESLKSAGILQNEIYLLGNETFEFYEVSEDFDWAKSWEVAESNPKSEEWGKLVGPVDVPYKDDLGIPLENQIMTIVLSIGKE